MSTVELFKALGDPTRLHIIEKLSNGKSYSINSLFVDMNISRQGARKHLKILENSKIIVLMPDGRNTIVQLNQKAFDSAKRFIAKLEMKWEKRLEALRAFVDGE